MHGEKYIPTAHKTYTETKRNTNTSAISFCGTRLPDHKELTHLDTEHKTIPSPCTLIPKKLRDFIGWDNDSETLQGTHTLRHSVPKSAEISHSGHSRKQFWGLKLWTWTLSTPYSHPTSQTLRVHRKSRTEISHLVTQNTNTSETFRPEHIPQKGLTTLTLGYTTPQGLKQFTLGHRWKVPQWSHLLEIQLTQTAQRTWHKTPNSSEISCSGTPIHEQTVIPHSHTDG